MLTKEVAILKSFISLLFLTLPYFQINAQNLRVSTVAEKINASGGVTMGPDGHIYISDFGPAFGSAPAPTKTYRVNSGTWQVSVFAEGFEGASGACFDREGNFYQSNPFGHKISKISPDGSINLDWATENLNVPVGIQQGPDGNFYVCNCSNKNIVRIKPDGRTTVFAEGDEFTCPNGLTIDPQGNLYACNFPDGKILKITPEAEVSVLTQIPQLLGGPNPVGAGHLTWKNDFLFVTAIGRGVIYKVDRNGNLELIAGKPNGFSNNDGPALEATFSKPNGIAASVTGDTLYVNVSDPTWVNNPGALHPAHLRMITGVCSLPDVDCPPSPERVEETPSKLTEAQWLEDIDFLEEKIKKSHLKPFTNVTESTFDSILSDIRKNIATYPDDKIIAELSKTVALFGWGHTRINLPVEYRHLGLYQGHRIDEKFNSQIKPFTVLPLRFVKFQEGIFIQSATTNYKSLLGKKVTHIGHTAIEDALNKMEPYTSCENQSALNLMAPVYLSIVNLLSLEKIISTIQSVPLSFSDGTTANISPLSYGQNAAFTDEITHNNISKPLWLQDTKAGLWQVADEKAFWTEPEQYFWHQFIPDKNTLYIKINYIAEHSEMSLASFMREAMEVAEEKKVKKLIIDLRHNTGGMGDSNRAIMLALQRWSGIAEFGKAFVLVGRKTYSAAILLLLELEKNANVIFVGEEIGGKPGHIGDAQRFLLPNSQLTLRVSVAEHKDWTGIADRSSVWLHYPIAFNHEDYSQGKDAALDFALGYDAGDLKNRIVEIYKNTNINVGIIMLYHLYTDPRSSEANHAQIAHSFANFLFKTEKNIRYAKFITNVSLEYNPVYIPLLLLKAEIAIAEDDRALGNDTLDKVLELDPGNKTALKLSGAH